MKDWSRRTFMGAAATLPLSLSTTLGNMTPATALAPSAAPVESPGLALQGAGIYRFTIDAIVVTALSDGTVPLDLHQLLIGSTAAHTDALLKRSFLSNPVEVSINEWVFKIDGRVVLVDAGTGQLFGPGYGGKLVQSLAAAAIKPEEVTDVLITHIHPDHSGGLLQSGTMVFPKATIHVGRPDLTFFMDRSNAAMAHVDIKFFEEAIQTFKPYLDAGKVKAFDQPTEIMPGLTAEVHPGHTPGSAFYALKSGSQSILFVGDIIHVSPVQFPDPTIAITYDVDPTAAVLVREHYFRTLGRDRTLIAVPHLPFPGVGHIAAVGNGFQWIPINYGNRDSK